LLDLSTLSVFFSSLSVFDFFGLSGNYNHHLYIQEKFIEYLEIYRV